MTFHLTHHVDIEPEFLYVRKCEREVFSATILGTTFSGQGLLTQPYFEVPLVMKLKVAGGSRTAVRLVVGGFAGSNRGRHLQATFDQNPAQNQLFECEHAQTGDAGGIVGAELAFRPLSVTARYERGFIPMSAVVGAPAAYHSGLVVGMAVGFGH